MHCTVPGLSLDFVLQMRPGHRIAYQYPIETPRRESRLRIVIGNVALATESYYELLQSTFVNLCSLFKSSFGSVAIALSGVACINKSKINIASTCLCPEGMPGIDITLIGSQSLCNYLAHL